MARDKNSYTSQTIKPQARMAKGIAKTRPRANPRPGLEWRSRAPNRKSGNGSFILIALSIMINDLLLLVRPSQTSGQFPRTTPRKNSDLAAQPAARKNSDRSLFSGAWSEFATVAVIIRLSFSKDPERNKKIEQVIYLGSSRNRRKRLAIAQKIALFMACLLAPRLAAAEEPVVETPIDLFDAQASPGVRVAPSLILQAGADATVLYDSNIYNDEVTKRDDTVGILKPSFKLATDLPRHGFALLGAAEIRRYFNTTDENSEQYELKGQGAFDLGSRVAFSTEALIADRIEPRGTAGDLFNTDRPVRYSEKKIAAELARTGGILELVLDGAIAKLTFDDPTKDGVPIDLGYRDAVVRQASIRTNYKVSPKVAVYGQLSGNQVDYSEQTAIPRNSSGYAVLGGLHYQVTALIDLEGAVGYIHQNFDNPLTDAAKGFNYQLKASWTPAPEWKFTAAGHRSVDPSPLSTVPAIIRSDFELTAQRAVSDRILLEASVAYVDEEYRTTTRIDKRYLADAAVYVRITERIGASVHAGYRKQDSADLGQSYDGASAGVTLSVKL